MRQLTLDDAIQGTTYVAEFDRERLNAQQLRVLTVQTTATNATRERPVWRGFYHCIPYQGGDRALSVCGGRINLDGSAA